MSEVEELQRFIQESLRRTVKPFHELSTDRARAELKMRMNEYLDGLKDEGRIQDFWPAGCREEGRTITVTFEVLRNPEAV